MVFPDSDLIIIIKSLNKTTKYSKNETKNNAK